MPKLSNPAKWGPLIEMTDKRTWKSKAFLIGISAIGSLLVCSALVSTLELPLLTSAGLLSWLNFRFDARRQSLHSFHHQHSR